MQGRGGKGSRLKGRGGQGQWGDNLLLPLKEAKSCCELSVAWGGLKEQRASVHNCKELNSDTIQISLEDDLELQVSMPYLQTCKTQQRTHLSGAQTSDLKQP